MSVTPIRALTTLFVSALLAPECLAQRAPIPTREEALAEARKALAACQALPDSNGGKKACVTACGKAVESLPTTEEERIPKWAANCGAYSRLANYHRKSAERAVVINAEREKEAAETRAANQKASAELAASKKAAAEKAAADRAATQVAAASKPLAAASAKPASVSSPATAPSAGAAPPASGRLSLSTEGSIDWGEFENELTFYRVFNGEFDSYRKGSLAVRALMTYYLEGFEAFCGDFLPPDAVTMVRKTFLVSENAAGFEERELIGTTEIRMAPRFTRGYENYSAGAGMAAFVDVQRPDRMMKDAVDFLKTWQKDARLLFSVEACQGPVMLQLGENIARVTSGRPPVQSEPNAAQLLANRRVRVPQNVEDADVRTKRAKADAWWNAQRASWGKPPQTEVLENTPRGNWIRVKYQAIAPDFQVPVPAARPDQVVQIDVEKSYARRIRSIQLGFETLSPYDVNQFGPVNAATYRKDTRAAYEEGARILKCTYDAGGTLKDVQYWFRKAPQSIDVEAARATWPDHPLLKVRSPRNDCPVAMP